MTIVVTFSDGEKLLSISDGMISRRNADGKISNVLSSVQKFICFCPCIKVPSIRMGRVDSISRIYLPEIYLSYAGNYSTISAIASEFGTIINSQLFAEPLHELGSKPIYRDRTLTRVQIGENAWDDLKGHQLPLAPFGVPQAADLIEELINKHASDFVYLQMDNPDVELQLFGQGKNGIECIEIYCKGLCDDNAAVPDFKPTPKITKRIVPAYGLSIIGNSRIKTEIAQKFDPESELLRQQYETLVKTVDELFDENNEYDQLHKDYRDLSDEIEKYVKEIIAKNENGVGGEAKVLKYERSEGYSISYY